MKFSKQALQAVALLAAMRPLKVLGAFNPYSTEVHVYLDPTTSGGADEEDTRWELSSAVSRIEGDNACAFRRDFIFTCGWYAADGWICIASNNSVGNPRQASLNPYTLPSEAGWYTFRHEFSVVGGALSVDFKIIDDAGMVLNTWTRSDPSDVENILAGNRYGWFVRIGCFTFTPQNSCIDVDSTFKLAIDDTEKCVGNGVGCSFFQGFEEGVADWQEFGGGMITRVPTNTDGIPSFAGNFHAQVTPGPAGVGPFGRWGGFCSPARDLCPETEEGVLVDANGCSDDQVDEDGDGICNLNAASTGPSGCQGEDLCPGTAEGDEVDENGCSDDQVDEDGDGICDMDAASTGPSGCEGEDLCPGTAEGDEVDENGCSDAQKQAICFVGGKKQAETGKKGGLSIDK
jgi:hypothetical protein